MRQPEELWRQYQDVVYRRCLSLLRGCHQEAEEAYSRVAMAVLQSSGLRQSDSLRSAKAWLLTVTRNVCMDVHRERKRGREVSLEALTAAGSERGEAASFPFVEPWSDPESLFLARERESLLRSSIERLPARLREAAELCLVRDLRYSEAARELGISEVNLRKRIQEARALLRRTLDLYLAGEPPLEKTKERLVRRGGTANAQTLRAVQVRLPDGVERDVVLCLSDLPRRRDPLRVERLIEYIRRHPRGWRRRLDLARSLAGEGRLSEALPHYRHVVERQPFPLTPWLELGACLEALGEGDAAIKAFAAGAREAGKRRDRLHLQGLAEARRRQWDAAHETLAAAAAADAMEARHLRALGEVCLAAGRPLAAVAALDRCLDLSPADPMAAVLSHDSLLEAGRPLAALRRVSRAAAGEAASFLALERLLRHRLRAGRIDRVTDMLRRRLKRLHPERAETVGAGALYELARGRVDDAAGLLLAYLERHPVHGRAWLHLGRLRRRAGQASAAVEAVLTALRFEPDDRDVYFELCRVLPAAGCGDAMRRLLAAVEERFAADAPMLAAASKVAVAVGELGKASELSHRAVALEPCLPALLFRRARALVAAGELEAAITELEEGWRLLPPDDGYCDSAPAALLLSSSYARLGCSERSREWSRTALEHAALLHPIDPVAARACRDEALALAAASASRNGGFSQPAGSARLKP